MQVNIIGSFVEGFASCALVFFFFSGICKCICVFFVVGCGYYGKQSGQIGVESVSWIVFFYFVFEWGFSVIIRIRQDSSVVGSRGRVFERLRGASCLGYGYWFCIKEEEIQVYERRVFVREKIFSRKVVKLILVYLDDGKLCSFV